MLIEMRVISANHEMYIMQDILPLRRKSFTVILPLDMSPEMDRDTLLGEVQKLNLELYIYMYIIYVDYIPLQ